MSESQYIHLFCGFFIVAGIFVLGLGIRLCRRANATRSWPSAEGVVRRSKIEERRSAKGHPFFQPVITYEYSVNGQFHSSTRIRLLDAAGSESAARRVLAQYPIGTKVTVYYNAASPGDAVLRRGMDGNTLGVAFLGLFFILFPVGFLWLYRT